MTDDTRNISINVQATQAIRNLTRTGLALEEVGTATGKSDRELRRLDRILLQAQGTANNAARTLGRLKVEMNQMGKEATASANTIRALESRLATANRRIAEQKVVIQDLRSANKMLAADNEKLGASFTKAGSQAKAGTDAMAAGAKKASASLRNLDENFQMNALRYALYDVAGNLSLIAGAGTLAFKSFFQTGIEFEKNFANVQRTSQLTGRSVDILRESFLDLQSTIPVSSEELTRIGTLAAQMGIAASQVASFTEITAKFAATSGISADEAATSLARVGQLLGDDVRGDYERLASAILKTGVNAIATEQQIVRGTTQIASIGKVAGLSAVDVVALSSAMSSLGMSPELQRSIITSSFTKILTAVRGSTDAAEKFGSVLGMTGKEFQTAWEGDGYNTYRKLLAAIAASPNAIGLLQDLGLASQRLTPNLLKMGQAYGLLGQTQKDTQQGWDEDIELQRQYQIIADTTAAKLDMLSGAWEAFITVVGSDAVSALGDFADWLREALIAYREFAKTDGGKFITGLVLGIGAIVTVGAALLTFVTLAGAGILGFDFVVRQLNASLATGSGLLGGFKVKLDTVAASSGAARTAVSLLSIAARALGAAMLALAVIEFAPDLLKGAREAVGIIPDLDDVAAAITRFNKTQIRQDLGLDRDTENWFDRFGSVAGYDPETFFSTDDNFFFDVTGLNSIIDTTKKYDQALASLVQSGNAAEAAKVFRYISDELVKQGADPKDTLGYFKEYMAALGMEAGSTADDLERYQATVEDTATEEEKAALKTVALANSLGLITSEFTSAEDALSSFVSAIQSGMGGFFDIGSLLEQAYGTEEGQGGGLARLQQDLDANLASAKVWSDGLASLVQRGAGSLAQAFAEQGPASQQAVTDALTLGDGDLARLEQSMSDAAFFASEAYARAFASDNAILADVYKKALAIDPSTALDALHETRELLTANGGILDAATIAALESKYGLSFDVSLIPTVDEEQLEIEKAALASKQVEIPVIPKPGTSFTFDPLFSADETTTAWQVELDGKTLYMDVDPKTEEGRALIQQWRDDEYAIPVAVQTWADTSGADIALQVWRDVQASRVLNIQVRASMPDLNGDVSGSGRPGVATGGLLRNGQIIRSNYPAFAKGTILRGPGTGTSDSILARLSNGEAVTRAAAVRYYGPKMMDDINRMRFPRYAQGFTPGSSGGNGGGSSVNINMTQNYPTTRDPIKTMKKEAEAVLAGIWD